MCTVGQDEVVIVLELIPGETRIPRDVLVHLQSVYEEANKGQSQGTFSRSICAAAVISATAPRRRQESLLCPSVACCLGVACDRMRFPWSFWASCTGALQHCQVFSFSPSGNTVSHLSHTIFGQNFLGSKDHSGFLYLRPSFQCLQQLVLPEAPYVFGILLQRWETPWVKIFPLRLMLRLGAEFRCELRTRMRAVWCKWCLRRGRTHDEFSCELCTGTCETAFSGALVCCI